MMDRRDCSTDRAVGSRAGLVKKYPAKGQRIQNGGAEGNRQLGSLGWELAGLALCGGRVAKVEAE